MANYVYVDNSNVWIEGMRVSAVAHGAAPDIYTAMQNHILDQSWRIDIGRLFEFAVGDDVGRAILYGSRPPENDSLWNRVKQVGFEVHVQDRTVANRERGVDEAIITDMLDDSHQLMDPATDEITLVAGDGGYMHPVTRLIQRGFKVDVVFWDQAARDLKDCCSNFISLRAEKRTGIIPWYRNTAHTCKCTLRLLCATAMRGSFDPVWHRSACILL